ncbi:ATP-binding protein [Paracoccus sp. (in: a-proteobacteria)]|uniref:ATP-binding protein n=1 Tax=Paracoccus sp. TaxID=267 RepID=UPI0028A69B82|nr:ATP-binding protein [Paracoccus sp. (in: a-proteobacteria)]
MQHEHVAALARELSLAGFADTLDRQSGNPLYTEMAFIERVASLLIAEKERRASSRLTRMLNEAKLPMKAAPEELINTETRGLKPSIMRELLKCDWIPHAWNILISGETGTGKSWVASCIATAAIRAGYKTRYFKVSDLLYSLSMTLEDGMYLREREKLAKFKLLILDDFGKVAMNEGEKSILFDIIEDRTGKLSTIIVGQRPYNDWHSFIDNPVIADAVLDRLSRDRHHIKLRGESLRRREASFNDL